MENGGFKYEYEPVTTLGSFTITRVIPMTPFGGVGKNVEVPKIEPAKPKTGKAKLIAVRERPRYN